MKKALITVLAFVLSVFSAFADVPQTLLEYVQSTANLYVDIDFIPTCTSVVETVVSFDELNRNNTIFCSRDTAGTTFTLFYIYNSNGKSNFRWDYTSTARATANFTPVADTLYSLRATSKGLYLFGSVLGEDTSSTKPFTPRGKMILFGSYTAGNSITSGLSNYSRMKMYSFRIRAYEGGPLVVDLVPAFVDGAAVLYDRVRDRVFAPSGNALTAGPEASEPSADISLRQDVIDRCYGFTPSGTDFSGKYGATNLYDGFAYTTAMIDLARDARWLGNDDSVQVVDIDPAYFNERSGLLLKYVLHKVSMETQGIHSRAPTAWRLEGVEALSADDDAWKVIDEQTNFTWPGNYTYATAGNNDQPESRANSTVTFSVPSSRQVPYRRLRFVPTDSYAKTQDPQAQYFYSLMEVDFRVEDGLPGMPADALVVSGDPNSYGEPTPAYGTTNGLAVADTVECSIPEFSMANEAETLRARCIGWKVYSYNSQTRSWVFDEDDPDAHGDGNSFTYTHGATAAKVEWQFRMQAYVDASSFGVGTVAGSGWYDLGETVELSSAPGEGRFFRHWNGLPAGVADDTASVSFTVTGPVAASAVMGQYRWVSSSTGDDAENDGSETRPFKTIVRAMSDLGVYGGVIYVAPGTYKEADGSGALTGISVTNEFSIIGTGNRAEDVKLTVNLTDDTRHVIRLDHERALLKNIWVTEGNQWTNNYGNSDCGMNVRIGPNGGTVEECAITGIKGGGNYAQKGQSLWMDAGRVSRCRIINNKNGKTGDDTLKGTAIGAGGGVIEDCLIASNTCQYASAVYLTGTARMVNCTIVDNSGPGYSGVYIDSDTAAAVNCVIFGNTAADTVAGRVYRSKSERFFNCASDLELPGSTGCVVGLPQFAGPGDYRPTAGSCCYEAGTARAPYGATGVTDLGGQARVVGAAVDIGCYENQQDELACGISWTVNRALAPGDVAIVGVASGASGEVTYGWTVSNEVTGATFDVPASTSPEYGFTDVPAGLYTVSLTITCDGLTARRTEAGAFRIAPQDLYVDAASGTPAFPYADRGSAAADIATALTAAVDGSTVHVADGTYEISAQLALDKGVRIVGESGCPSRAVVRRTANDVRIALLNHPDALVANLTLANGRLKSNGGGVYINASGGTVSNCIIRGCSTYGSDSASSGALYMLAGLVIHTEMRECEAEPNKSTTSLAQVLTARGGRVSNCLIRDNTARYKGYVVNVAFSGIMENCTIAGNTVVDSSAVNNGVDKGTSSIVRNCAIFCVNTNGAPASCSGYDSYNNFFPNRFYNCVTSGAIQEYTTGNGGKGWYYGNSCVTNVTPEACFRNPAVGDYHVLRGGPLVNRSMTGVGLLPEFDFDGHARVYKGGIDVGCYEDFDQGLELRLR